MLRTARVDASEYECSSTSSNSSSKFEFQQMALEHLEAKDDLDLWNERNEMKNMKKALVLLRSIKAVEERWRMKDLNFIPNKELDKEILIPIPRESKIGKDCDFPLGDDFQSFKTFSNPLFEKQDDFPSRNDESILKEEVEKDNDEVNHEVFKSENENDLGVHDNEEEEIAFLDGLLEDENFFEINDKKGKIFDPGITFHEEYFEKDAFNDKSSKELAPSKALLILDVFDPLHPPLMNFHVWGGFHLLDFLHLTIYSIMSFSLGESDRRKGTL
ncbi:hypothetical protein Tco_0728978 [Tanacetum coccineum]|uniref:Uncharacterized protein n=1 Tax=Tanacetum coccineum TaxID=301880 RepID=A0ABQ4YNH8_9ASTR